MRKPAATLTRPATSPPVTTPATTGTTSTRAAVAMARCVRSGTIAAPSPTEASTPTPEPMSRLRTLHCPPGVH